MGKNNDSKILIVLGVLIVAITSVAAYFNISKTNNYKNNGKEVECEVVAILQSSKGSQQVQAVYVDEAGNVIKADAVLNDAATLGEKFTGLVVPEKPNEIYCPASENVERIAHLVFGAIWVVGAALVVWGIVIAVKNKIKY